VNFHLPEAVAAGQATVTITSGAGEVSRTFVTVDAVAPAVFTQSMTGTGEAAVIATADGVNYTSGYAKLDPARDVYVSLFGTGWRAAAGGTVTVELNGAPVAVAYAGAQGFFVGLDQINLKLPRPLAPGSHSLVVKIGTRTSNSVLLRVQ
jgi:uncharacterized protein (TIGR03437 family)